MTNVDGIMCQKRQLVGISSNILQNTANPCAKISQLQVAKECMALAKEWQSNK
jgi:hypothetical protein